MDNDWMNEVEYMGATKVMVEPDSERAAKEAVQTLYPRMNGKLICK